MLEGLSLDQQNKHINILHVNSVPILLTIKSYRLHELCLLSSVVYIASLKKEGKKEKENAGNYLNLWKFQYT